MLKPQGEDITIRNQEITSTISADSTKTTSKDITEIQVSETNKNISFEVTTIENKYKTEKDSDLTANISQNSSTITLSKITTFTTQRKIPLTFIPKTVSESSNKSNILPIVGIIVLIIGILSLTIYSGISHAMISRPKITQSETK